MPTNDVITMNTFTNQHELHRQITLSNIFSIKGTSIISYNHTHKLQASHKHTMGKCFTLHQLLSCTLQICYPSHSHDDLCGTSRITMDFQGCNEAWLQRKLVFLDIQRLSSKRATKM